MESQPAARVPDSCAAAVPYGRTVKSADENDAIRELGGVFGVAVLASMFSAYGGYPTHETFINGMNAAVWIGAGVVRLGGRRGVRRCNVASLLSAR
jgi:hypothetical protein